VGGEIKREEGRLKGNEGKLKGEEGLHPLSIQLQIKLIARL
jgi:hypothetical protein